MGAFVFASISVSFYRCSLRLALTLCLWDGLIHSIGVLLPTITKEFNAGQTRASPVHRLIGTITLGACPMTAKTIKVAERSFKKFCHLVVSDLSHRTWLAIKVKRSCLDFL